MTVSCFWPRALRAGLAAACVAAFVGVVLFGSAPSTRAAEATPSAAVLAPLAPLGGVAAWQLDGDQIGAELGDSVATAGDVNGDGYSDVLVSAPFHDGAFVDEGRAWLYLGSASGVSTTPAWVHDGGQDGANFGVAVNTAGDVNGDGYDDVLIGACRYDNGQTDEGRAYLFYGSPAGLSATPAWITESNQAGAYYGHAVAGAGDVNGDGYDDVLIGADWYDNGQTDEGGAWLYYGSATGLSTTAAWHVEGDNTDAFLGTPVTGAGDVNGDGYADIAAGAWGYTTEEFQGEGRAYVYLGGPSGPSTTAVFTVEGEQAQAGMGTSISAAGDINGDGYGDLIVGASRYAEGNGGNAGKAELYLGGPAGPDTTADWRHASGNVDARYGGMVSTAGDINGDGYADVLVAAWNDRETYYDEGIAQLYLGSAAGLDTGAVWTSAGNSPNGHYGWSLDTAGDVNGDGYSDVIVSGPLRTGSLYRQGSAYVFHGGPAGPDSLAAWTLTGSQGGAAVGAAVSMAGDVDGDGYGDLLVGAPTYDHGQTDEGRAVLFRGSATGYAATPDWSYESNQANAQCGGTLASAGDVNGDGYTDVLVGAPLYDGALTDVGRALLFLGSPTGLALTPAWTATGTQANEHLASALAAAGDVNGDGFADVVVAAAQLDTAGTDAGAVYCYLGTATGLTATPAWAQRGDVASGQFGAAVSGAGDVDRDGYSDVIIGQPTRTGAFTGEGRAWLYRGSPSGLLTTASWQVDGGQVNAALGASVAHAGDVDGDRYSDVIVGASSGSATLVGEGIARLYRGSATGLSPTASWTAAGGQLNAHFGSVVAGAGDVDGDGRSDVLVTAPQFDSSMTDRGEICLYRGTATGLSPTPVWFAYGDQASAQFGRAATAGGDVTGDGAADIVIGEPFYAPTVPLQRAGRVFLYSGNYAAGPDRLARQRRADGSAPLDLNALIAPPSMRLSQWARTPAGRGTVRVEYEIKPLSQAFDGTGLGVSGWLDTGAPSGQPGSRVAFDQLVSTISQAGGYHWRMRTRSPSPHFPRSPWVSFVPSGATEAAFRSSGTIVAAENPEASAVATFALALPSPNPARARCALRYTLPADGPVRIAVYDVRGRWLGDLVHEAQRGGEHAVSWSLRDPAGRRVAAGEYMIRLTAAGRTMTQTVMVSR